MGDRDRAVLADRRETAHEAAPEPGGAGRNFDRAFLLQRRQEVQVDGDGDAGVVAVRHDPYAGALQHPCQPQGFAEAAEHRQVGLGDVEGMRFEKGRELPAGGEAQIAHADGDGRRGAQPRVPGHVVEGEGRLDPGEVQFGQQVQEGRQLIEARELLRGIEHEAALRPHQRAQVGEVPPHPRRLRPPGLDADLEVAEALVQQRRDLGGDARGLVLQGIDRRVGGQAFATRSAQRRVDRDSLRAGEEVPDGDVERADRVHRRAAPAVPLRARVHLVPEAARVVHGLSADDAGEPLRTLVVGRHLDRRLDERGRRVALADSREPVVAVDQDQDVLVAALEAVVEGLRVLQADDLHPLDRHRHRAKSLRA